MRSGALLTTIFLLITGLTIPNRSYAQCSTSSTPTNNCSGYGDAIDRVTINGVSTTSGSSNGCGTSGYGSYSAPVFKLVPGQSNTVSALLGSGTESEGFAIFIDLNNDGYFSGSNELVYQYGSSGTNISGTFTIPTTGVTYGTPLKMRFRCIWFWYPWSISDACGNNLGGYGETEDYSVIMCSPVSITTQPMDTAICQNNDASFNVVANSTDVTYQWQANQQGNGFLDISNGANYSGTTSSTLSIIGAPPIFDGTTFRCIVRSNCNTNIADTSAPALLAVAQNASVTNQPITDTTCEGLNVSFNITTQGSVLAYEWQKYITGSGWVTLNNTPPYSGATTQKLQITSVVDTLNGALYRCIVSGQCIADTTDTISLGVNSIPKVITQPTNVSTIQGNNANFNIIAAGVGVSYRWQAGVNGTFSNINNQSVYSGVHTANLTVYGVTEAQSGFEFRCIVQGTGGCAAAPDTSNIALLNVLPPLTVNNIASTNSSVYPNPVSGSMLNIVINNNVTGKLSYTIVNSVGEIVQQGILNNDPTHNTKLSVETLSSGVYTIQVNNDKNENVETLKFTKI